MTTQRTFVDFYTGEFADEETAIVQVIDCAILSIPGEWRAVNGNIGTNILPYSWRFKTLDKNIIETFVKSALEPYKNWFRVITVEVQVSEQIPVRVSVMLIESRVTLSQTVLFSS